MRVRIRAGVKFGGIAALMAVSSLASGQSVAPDRGKLLLTGGVRTVEGTGGGGLATWALITGYGTDKSYGANVQYTHIDTQDYRLSIPGIAVGIKDRVELSFAEMKIEGNGAPVPIDGATIRQNMFGIKVRLFGDAVYGQDQWYPQVAIGAIHKRNRGIEDFPISSVEQAPANAESEHGTDYYIAATKLFLAQSLLLNGTVRFTKANQFGLLGFGGDKGDDYEPHFEGSIAYLLSKNLAIGAEYRSKPRNLSIDKEKDAHDVFIAWAPSKYFSATLAYAHLGPLISALNPQDQEGFYLSLTAGF